MRTDYLKDETNDLVIKSGDFVNAPSADQHVADILLASPGNWRQHPLLGIGIKQYLSGPWSANKLRRAIRLQIEELDGQPVADMDLRSPNTFKIEV